MAGWKLIALEVSDPHGRSRKIRLEAANPDETSFTINVERQCHDDALIMTDQRWRIELMAGGFGALPINEDAA